MKNKTAIVLLAHGCEELEAVSIIDVLRRGGVSVTTLSVESTRKIEGAHGIAIEADGLLADFGDETAADAVALPGGMKCMMTMRDRAEVQALLKRFAEAGKTVAAVCASPVALGAAGLLENRRFVCYPGMQAHIEGGTYVSDAPAVRDGNIVTGTGPGTAPLFALELLEALADRTVRDSVAEGMLL